MKVLGDIDWAVCLSNSINYLEVVHIAERQDSKRMTERNHSLLLPRYGTNTVSLSKKHCKSGKHRFKKWRFIFFFLGEQLKLHFKCLDTERGIIISIFTNNLLQSKLKIGKGIANRSYMWGHEKIVKLIQMNNFNNDVYYRINIKINRYL